MRRLWAWAAYVLVVLVGGALLAPWLYAATQWGAQHFGGLEDVAQAPFHHYVNRCVLALALIGLLPLLRQVGACSWRELGLTRLAGQWKRFGAGFIAGFGSLALVAALAIAAHGRHWTGERTTADIARHVVFAGGAAIAVSMLEEVLFRGALFGSLRRAHGVRVGLVVSSGIYALVHFFARVRWDSPVEWWAGLAVLGRMCGGFVELGTLVPGFLCLALAGGLLAAAYDRTGNLWCSIGLHAGWIFWLKSYGFITAATPGASVWFWGTERLIDGWLALLVLGASGAVLTGLLPRAANQPYREESDAN